MKIVSKSNGRSHWYADADAGNERVPGVTTIISDGLPKPALLNWAGDATAEYAVDNWDDLAALPYSERLKKIKGGRYEKRDAAANKGTQIHKLAQRLVAGEKVTIPDAIKGYVESCVRFIDDFDLSERYVEATIYSETHRYAGRLDMIADIVIPEMPEYDYIDRDDAGYATALLDWKTGRSGIFGDVSMQLSAYRYADKLVPEGEDPIDMPAVDFCAGVHIRADGYTLVPLTCDEDQFRDFLYIKEVARLVGNLRDLVSDPIVPPTAFRYRLSKVDEESNRA